MTKNFPIGSCFSFMYLLNGASTVSKINVYKKTSSASDTLGKIIVFSVKWQNDDFRDKNWKQAHVPLGTMSENFEIYLEVELDSTPILDKTDNIAIDDVTLSQGDCTVDPTTAFDCGNLTFIEYNRVCDFVLDCGDGRDELDCADCDFEKSTCQYTDLSYGDIKWTREQAGLSQYGPNIDVTLNSPDGYYLYVDENTNPVDTYDYALLLLEKTIRSCSSTCELEFYYYMYGGADMLGVFLLIDDTDTYLAELDGSYGKQWNRYYVPIGRIARDFRLLFQALRYRGDDANNIIAIDDIKLKNCEYPAVVSADCEPGYFRCMRNACVLENRRCDLTDDCGDFSDEFFCASLNYTQCDFEEGICDWENNLDMTSELKWELYRGYTPTPGTGPKRDHTLGTSDGQYIYLGDKKNEIVLNDSIIDFSKSRTSTC